MDLPAYVIERAPDPARLEALVRNRLEAGYVPLGGVAVAAFSPGTSAYAEYLQAMALGAVGRRRVADEFAGAAQRRAEVDAQREPAHITRLRVLRRRLELPRPTELTEQEATEYDRLLQAAAAAVEEAERHDPPTEDALATAEAAGQRLANFRRGHRS